MLRIGPGYLQRLPEMRSFIPLQDELFVGLCLVIVIISIYFVFLIGVFCLLQVFRSFDSDLKSE
jgi:hypothetical protein